MSIGNATKADLARVFEEIVTFRGELKAASRKELKEYLGRNESFIVEGRHKDIRDEINAMLRDLPHSLFLFGFLRYGSQAELWANSDPWGLYSRNVERAEALSRKYGLAVTNGTPWEEIRLIEKGIDDDILYLNEAGQLIVHLDFPRAVGITRDVLNKREIRYKQIISQSGKYPQTNGAMV